MTKIKSSIFQKTSLIVATFLLLVAFFSNLSVQARITNPPINAPAPVAKDRTAPITVYLPYGSATAETDIQNPIAKATLDKNDLEFVNTGIEDWYNGSPTRPDSENPPAQAACDASFSGNKYQINSSLISPSEFSYGLQSARNLTAPSGSASVDKLRQKATGCIKFTLKVSATATVGNSVKLTFDEDFGASSTYTEANRPGIQEVNFTIGPAAAVASSSSSSTESSRSSSSAISSAVAVVSSAARSSALPAPVTSDLSRTGGAEIITVVALISAAIVGFICFKVYSNRLKKVDVGGKNFKGKKSS